MEGGGRATVSSTYATLRLTHPNLPAELRDFQVVGWTLDEKYCWNLEEILWCSRNKIGCGLQQNWLRPYDSSSSAPTALMNELSTANILSIHVPILKVYFLGGATRFEGSRSRQSQIGLCKGVSSSNWHPDTCQLGNPTRGTSNQTAHCTVYSKCYERQW